MVKVSNIGQSAAEHLLNIEDEGSTTSRKT